eukprot:1561345-Amphidinium_carterae.1
MWAQSDKEHSVRDMTTQTPVVEFLMGQSLALSSRLWFAVHDAGNGLYHLQVVQSSLEKRTESEPWRQAAKATRHREDFNDNQRKLVTPKNVCIATNPVCLSALCFLHNHPSYAHLDCCTFLAGIVPPILRQMRHVGRSANVERGFDLPGNKLVPLF